MHPNLQKYKSSLYNSIKIGRRSRTWQHLHNPIGWTIRDENFAETRFFLAKLRMKRADLSLDMPSFGDINRKRNM